MLVQNWAGHVFTALGFQMHLGMEETPEGGWDNHSFLRDSRN